MKIGIDTFGLEHAQSGLGSYLYYLVNNLPETEGVQYELFGQESDRYTYKAKFDIEYTSVDVAESITKERWWHLTKANRFAESRKYDAVIYCAATKMLPLKFGVKGIVVVNSIFSETLSTGNQLYLKNVLSSALKKADAIIAPSEYIKNDLLDFGFKKEKIHVIPNGLDHSVFYQHDLDQNEFVDIKPFAIKKPYLIYPSKISGAEKKHVELIKAFNLFKEKTKLSHRLVLAGSQNDYAETVQKEVLASPFASDIFMTGFFPQSEFALLYANSDGCLFPASREGIGLPVLEAMASGIPVACSDTCALPEISGKNAVLFDPDNISQMAAAIEQITTNQDLRKDLIDRGIKWSSNYAWENTALKIVELIKNL